MARFTGGDIVLFPMPFFGGTDYLVCYITSQQVGDPHSLVLLASDIRGGILTLKSYIRPLYLFAPAEHTIVRKIGTLDPAKLKQVRAIIASVVDP